jgi:hypothetical protein
MIAAHNLKEGVLAVVSLLVGILCFVLAFYFFRFAFTIVTNTFGLKGATAYSSAFAGVMVVIIGLNGFFRWRSGEGLYGYTDSSVFLNLDPVSGGAVAMDRVAHRITGPAYILSQMFLLGPLQLLSAYGRCRSIIRPNPALEVRLSELLNHIRMKNKWEGISDYPEQEREVALLIRMGKLDFSRTKMKFRAKN